MGWARVKIVNTNPPYCNRELLTPHGTETFQSISRRSLTKADENGSGDIDISLGYRRRGSVSSSLRSHKNRYREIQPINIWNKIRRLDHSRTYALDNKVAISLLQREVATKIYYRGLQRICCPDCTPNNLTIS